MACQKVLIVLMAVMIICVYTTMGMNTIQVNSLPCEPCQHDELPLWHFKKMSPICGPCGVLFGAEFEYCCMCDEDVRKDCMAALRK